MGRQFLYRTIWPDEAFRKRVPKEHDLNYTHFSLEVENIRDFRQAVIDCGGAEYLDTEIAPRYGMYTSNVDAWPGG